MKTKVLVAEDAEINREMLCEIVGEEYEVIPTKDGLEAIRAMEEHLEEIGVVLLDLIMPVLDGYVVLKIMQERKWQGKIPVIVISEEGSTIVEERCFDYGVIDFIRKPYQKSVIMRRIKNAVELFRYKNQLEERVQKQNAALKRQYTQLEKQAERLRRTNEEIIDILGNVVEGRNLESGQHIKRVKEFSRILGEKIMDNYREYNLTKEKVEMIAAASSLHDIGKIGIQDQVLLKPGKLTKEEYEYMKTHTLKGCEIISKIRDIWDQEYSDLSYEICRHHHERYDGKGYPDKLKGEEIPISAQIVSLADVYDALVSERVYKGAYSTEEAYQMILNGECGIFSPKLLESFCKAKEEMEKLVKG